MSGPAKGSGWTGNVIGRLSIQRFDRSWRNDPSDYVVIGPREDLARAGLLDGVRFPSGRRRVEQAEGPADNARWHFVHKLSNDRVKVRFLYACGSVRDKCEGLMATPTLFLEDCFESPDGRRAGREAARLVAKVCVLPEMSSLKDKP